MHVNRSRLSLAALAAALGMSMSAMPQVDRPVRYSVDFPRYMRRGGANGHIGQAYKRLLKNRRRNRLARLSRRANRRR